MGKVFISYSHIDKSFAEEIEQVLQELNIDYFRDVQDIRLGDSITSRVREEINSCYAILVIISPGSLKSHWVPYEIGHASALGKTILPFLTHPALDIPHYIRDLNCATDIDQIREYFHKTYSDRLDPIPTKDKTLLHNEVESQTKLSNVEVIESQAKLSDAEVIESQTKLNDAEVAVLKVLANIDETHKGERELEVSSIAIWSHLGKTKVEYCLRTLNKKGFAFGYKGKWQIADAGMEFLLYNLEDSPRITTELSNSEVAVSKVLANIDETHKGEPELEVSSIAIWSHLDKTKVEYCLRALQKKAFVFGYKGKWQISDAGMEFLFLNELL